MINGLHYATRDLAEAYLAQHDWTEVAVDTWVSDCGTHVASLKPVHVFALDVRPAPIVAVTVCHAVRQ